MIAFGKWIFKANSRMPGSQSTRLQQWQAIERQTGVAPGELANAPILPECLYPLWDTYWKIITGIDRLTLEAVNHYVQLYDDPLDPWEIDALIELDKVKQELWLKS